MIYHVGISISNKTMVIEARKSVDYLSCELYDYMGQRETTKRELYSKRYDLLNYMKTIRPEVYKRCKFAIVD